MSPYGLIFIKTIHHGWNMLIGASLNMELIVSSRWNYFPATITLVSYIILDRRCVFSLLETYFYPEICPCGYMRVNNKYIIMCIYAIPHIYLIRSDKKNIATMLSIWPFLILSERQAGNYFPDFINISPFIQYLF